MLQDQNVPSTSTTSIAALEVEHKFCNGCSWDTSSFYPITENEEKLEEFLIKHQMIQTNKNCPNCDIPMTLEETYFRCINKIHKWVKNKKKLVVCNKRVSQNSGTFFEHSHLSRNKICKFIAAWACIKLQRMQQLTEEVGVTRNTIIEFLYMMGEACTIEIIENNDKVGGPSKIVEMDKVKICKRKYSRGQYVLGEWLFGGLEQGSQKIFAVSMPDKTTETLTEVIKENILPGTTIISDCWKVYKKLGGMEPFTSLSKSYSFIFLDSGTEAHPEHIRSFWKQQYTRKNHRYLCELLFRYKYEESHPEFIHRTFLAIARIYNGNPVSIIQKEIVDSSED